ncbi:MAG: cell division ATP-binding protein FtsE [Bacteriovoracaceae bacterium]
MNRTLSKKAPSTLFCLREVSKKYGLKKQALQKVSFEMGRGEFIFLTGASGAGKSTLMKLIYGELSPTNGKLIQQLEETEMALLFQDVRCLQSMTVEDNLSYADTGLLGQKKFQALMNEYLNFFSLKPALDSRVSELSGGEQQLVALIRTLLTKPELALLDEPTSAMDEAKTTKVYDLISYLSNKEKLAILWATHDQALARKHFGRTIHLEKGRMIHAGRACFI